MLRAGVLETCGVGGVPEREWAGGPGGRPVPCKWGDQRGCEEEPEVRLTSFSSSSSVPRMIDGQATGVVVRDGVSIASPAVRLESINKRKAKTTIVASFVQALRSPGEGEQWEG